MRSRLQQRPGTTTDERSPRVSGPIDFDPEVEPGAVMLILQRAIGHPLKISQRRVGKVNCIEERTHVAGQSLADREIELAMRVVEPILAGSRGNLVDVRAG